MLDLRSVGSGLVCCVELGLRCRDLGGVVSVGCQARSDKHSTQSSHARTTRQDQHADCHISQFHLLTGSLVGN